MTQQVESKNIHILGQSNFSNSLTANPREKGIFFSKTIVPGVQDTLIKGTMSTFQAITQKLIQDEL